MITLEEFKKAYDENLVNELLSCSSKSEPEQLEIFRHALRRAIAVISQFEVSEEDKRNATLELTKIFLKKRFNLTPEEAEALRRQEEDIVKQMNARATPIVAPIKAAAFNDEGFLFKRPTKRNNFLAL